MTLSIKDFPRVASFPEPEPLYEAFRAYAGDVPAQETVKSSMYGDQDLFQDWKQQCVAAISREFETYRAIEDREKFYQSITSMIRELGTSRQVLGSHPEFGTWRKEAEKTALVRMQYRPANQKLRILFASCMPRFGHNETETQPESYTFGDKFSRYTIKRYTQSHQKWMYDLTLSFRYLKGEYGPQEEERIELLDTMRSIRREVISDLKLPELATENARSIPEGRSQFQFFVGTISNQVEGEWVPLTRHITWIKQKEPGPVTEAAMDYFKQYGYVTYLHTDKQQFDPLLRSIVNISHRLIQPNPDVKKFKADLAVLDYRFFHAMFFCRGSETITEIYREAMCQLQQQPVPKTMGEDALAEPFLVQYVNNPSRYAAPENGELKKETS